MERRASDRVTADLATRCRVPATPHPATVVDLSRTGCRIRLATAHLLPGTTVHIDLGRDETVSGMVAWTGAETAGIQFHRRLGTDVAVQKGIVQASETATARIEAVAEARVGLQHWMRAVVGFVKR